MMLPESVGIVAILAFIALLVLKECMRAFYGSLRGVRMRTLDIAIVLLGAVSGLVLATHFMSML